MALTSHTRQSLEAHMTATVISLNAHRKRREFEQLIDRMAADLAVMNVAELLLTDLTKHMERRASRGLPNNRSGSPSGSGSQLSKGSV